MAPVNQHFVFYFLCLDTKKVNKEKSRLQIFLGSVCYGHLHALQLTIHGRLIQNDYKIIAMSGSDSNAWVRNPPCCWSPHPSLNPKSSEAGPTTTDSDNFRRLLTVNVNSQSNNCRLRLPRKATRTGCPRLVRSPGEAVAGMRSLARAAGEGRPRTCQPWCTFFGSLLTASRRLVSSAKCFYKFKRFLECLGSLCNQRKNKKNTLIFTTW